MQLNVCLFCYIYSVCVCVCVCERERERERESHNPIIYFTIMTIFSNSLKVVFTTEN